MHSSYLTKLNEAIVMKVSIVFTLIIAVVYSTPTITLGGEEEEKYYDEKFLQIKSEAESHYQELPRNIFEDARLLVPQIIRKYGYPCEVHNLTTKDGYKLEVHRIPHGIKGPSKNRPAVLVQHGILMSSADWIITGPGKGLGYILADSGYDVWLTNARGTRYSRAHETLDPDEDAPEFWNFSWHEIALEDVSKFIDHIIEQTKQPKIFYVAHSQGTTCFFVLMSERPEYNNKIRAMFAMAPVAYMWHLTSPLMRIGALFEPMIEVVAKWVGLYEFLPHSTLLGQVGDTLCGDDSIMQILCTNSLFAICGFNKNQTNATLIPVIMGHTPAGTSTKQFLHFAQEINSGKFRQYDYRLKNRKHYGRLTPPSYNLKKVKAPVYLFYSNNDWMSHPKDVRKLYKKLPNLKGKFLSLDNKFNHADYLFGIDAPRLLYSRIISLMDRVK